ncbi:Structural maintenance of chromosomes protein 1 [Bonamia ostreae]|uniref:Structural maintenance of chromosomes protein 1 n=1 Tax=Bonamia ostreae TaxID=126728 RepID=A0ABV2ASF1_9EUKA
MAAAFQAIEKKRSELFCTTVRKVDEHIGTIYKRLTESEQFPMGGNAYLTLENADYRPFEHGVFLCAMPPSKRFREIESLSGGERSVAAMALLFAAHAFRPAPFFVLDEVDAALDKANAARLVRFLQRETESKRLQCIVVSLRESFYHKAEELVGVYKDVRRASSGVLTLDLEEFDAQSGQTLGSAIRKRGRSVGVSVSSFGSDLAVE